jgi:hypothetical protein
MKIIKTILNEWKEGNFPEILGRVFDMDKENVIEKRRNGGRNI